jgi:hypothetical protein
MFKPFCFLKDDSRIKRFFRLFQIVFWKFLICGTLQPIAALLTATILCPVGSLSVALFASIRKLLRRIWDNITYYLILKHQAKVPSRDTFVARRIAGPGLASNHFFQIKPEQALAALETHLEIKMLESYLEYITKKIDEPIELYKY